MSELRRQDRTWSLRIPRNWHDGVLLLALEGRVGVQSAPALGAELSDALGEGYLRLVIDFERVDYLSSAGLLVLNDAKTRIDALNGRLVLCAMSEPVRLVLDLAGLTSSFTIERSRERAIATCAGD